MKRVFAGLKNVGVPLIYYANDGGSLYGSIAQLDVDVVGVDWRTPLSAARRALGPNKGGAGQYGSGGVVLVARGVEASRATTCSLEAGPGPGHIFNLGHGIWQETDPDMPSQRLVDYVHEASFAWERPRGELPADFAPDRRELLPRSAGAHRRGLRKLRALQALRAQALVAAGRPSPQGRRRNAHDARRRLREGGRELQPRMGPARAEVSLRRSRAPMRPDGAFVACGISLVAHMYNPYVPAVHMNTRFLCTSKAWFGGGADLTPTFPFEEDTKTFHDALRAACDSYRPDAYTEYKAWCDRYFFLPHRKEPPRRRWHLLRRAGERRHEQGFRVRARRR